MQAWERVRRVPQVPTPSEGNSRGALWLCKSILYLHVGARAEQPRHATPCWHAPCRRGWAGLTRAAALCEGILPLPAWSLFMAA